MSCRAAALAGGPQKLQVLLRIHISTKEFYAARLGLPWELHTSGITCMRLFSHVLCYLHFLWVNCPSQYAMNYTQDELLEHKSFYGL